MPLRFKGVTSVEIKSFQTPEVKLWQFMSGLTLQSALDIFEQCKVEATPEVIEVAQELRRCLVGRPKGLRGTDLLVDVFYKISTNKRDKFMQFVRYLLGKEEENESRF